MVRTLAKRLPSGLEETLCSGQLGVCNGAIGRKKERRLTDVSPLEHVHGGRKRGVPTRVKVVAKIKEGRFREEAYLQPVSDTDAFTAHTSVVFTAEGDNVIIRFIPLQERGAKMAEGGTLPS